MLLLQQGCVYYPPNITTQFSSTLVFTTLFAVPRLSLLLRLNRALGGLPSHLATLLDPAHAYHHQQQQHQQQRRFTSPGSQIQTLRGTGSVPNDAAVASAPQAISTASATNSGTAEAAATAASHQTEGFTIRAVAGGGSDDDKHEGRSRDDEAEQPAALATNKGKRAKDAAADPVAVLEELGVKMYSKLSLGGAKGAMMGWESLAGYEHIRFVVIQPGCPADNSDVSSQSLWTSPLTNASTAGVNLPPSHKLSVQPRDRVQRVVPHQTAGAVRPSGAADEGGTGSQPPRRIRECRQTSVRAMQKRANEDLCIFPFM